MELWILHFYRFWLLHPRTNRLYDMLKDRQTVEFSAKISTEDGEKITNESMAEVGIYQELLIIKLLTAIHRLYRNSSLGVEEECIFAV